MVKYISDPNIIMAITSILMLFIVAFQARISSKQNKILEMQTKISQASVESAIVNLIEESDKTLTQMVDFIEKYRKDGLPKELAFAMMNECKKNHDKNLEHYNKMLEVLRKK